MTTSEYDWEACARDLALTTRLTLPAAVGLTWPLKSTNLNPEAAFPALRDLLNFPDDPGIIGTALARLLEAVR